MKTLIVYAHPWEGSFNHHVLEVSKKHFEDQGHSVDVIDLHKDDFDPVYHPEDLRLFAMGEYHDPQAKDYSDRLKQADNVVFIFPIWWYGVPAILKGFFDKVFLKGHTYEQNNKGEMTGILNTQKAVALTTAHIDQESLSQYFGSPVETLYLNGVMGLCGAKETEWIHCGNVHLEESREAFLKEIKEKL